jgi:hypothetical protein
VCIKVETPPITYFYIIKYEKHCFTKDTLTSPCASLSFNNPTRGIPLELEESQPKVKGIGYLGDSGDRPSSSLELYLVD